MINNTHTINIDGTVLKDEDIAAAFTFDKNDKFTKWVVRPLALLTVIGVGAAMFFASAFLIMLSLALMPIFAISFWAMKKKVERDLRNADPVVNTQAANPSTTEDTQTAS